MGYWIAQDTAAFTVVSIDFYLPETMDYDVFDAIVNRLRPRSIAAVAIREASWYENGDSSEYLKLLARASFLNNLQTCRLIVWCDAFPLSSFILNEPGYPNYELWFCHSKVAGGIEGFIENFVRDGCGNKKLESVCIQWDEWPDHPSPILKQLCTAMKIDVPLPKAEMLLWSIPAVHQVTQCETQSFVNAKQWKRMEVFKWSVENDDGCSRRTAHVLQCLVENL